jgi:hypothetical protein
MILSRSEFRKNVLERDNYKCVICGKPAVDAHHIIDRRLWSDGGYYLSNGASVCEVHHIECEKTAITVEEIRKACGITQIVLPAHLHNEDVYDKWGNAVLPNGTRLRGELFEDSGAQKMLSAGGVLGEFTSFVKYPRTHHLPWSPGMHDDDRMMGSINRLIGQRVVVTEKMDGENTTMYHDHIHARSIDGRSHLSRNWVKNMHSAIAHEIPVGWRVCGENLYAKHSIKYDNLASYFMAFSIWDEKNNCLSWDDSVEWFELLSIESVPLLYDGIYNEDHIKALYVPNSEGYVVRLADSFHCSDFRHCVGKYLRVGHVQTDEHWMYGQKIEKNNLVRRDDGLAKKCRP